jgi:hypothetical protein
LSEDPAVFFGDLVHDGFLQVTGEDAPGVGFDFEVRAELRMVTTVGEEIGDVILGGAERGGRIGVEGDVEMDPCFARRFRDYGGAFKQGQGFGKIGEALESGAALEDELMEVGGFIELPDGFESACVAPC